MRKKTKTREEKKEFTFFTATTARNMTEKYYKTEYERILKAVYEDIEWTASQYGSTETVVDVWRLDEESISAICKHLESNGYKVTYGNKVKKLWIVWKETS
jgi:hypothetical protein